MRMTKNNLVELRKIIDESLTIGVVSHINPDGDNLGSLLGLGLSLMSMDKNVTMIKADFIPSDYEFLNGVDQLKSIDDSLESLDLLFVVDCSDADRLGLNRFIFDKSNIVVNLDHHVSNSHFGDINLVDSGASSTGELVYRLIKDLNLPLDREIAQNLYVAISTDTGRFTYENVSNTTHSIIADLYNYDIEAYKLNKMLYQTRSINRTKLFIESISKVSFFNNWSIAIAKVTQEMLEKTNTKMEDTEGIVEFLRDTDSVEVAILLKEVSEAKIKVSLRTKSTIDANIICNTFGGGGHVRASGCTIEEVIEEAERLILAEVKKYMD